MAKLVSKLILDKECTAEISGDHEKWNECLDPDAMRFMWTVFLKKAVVEDWVLEMFNFPFLVFKAKTADMGEGLVFKKEKCLKRMSLYNCNSEFDKYKSNCVGRRKTNE